MENLVFPKWLISAEKKCMMRGKRGKQGLWDGGIVEGYERKRERILGVG